MSNSPGCLQALVQVTQCVRVGEKLRETLLSFTLNVYLHLPACLPIYMIVCRHANRQMNVWTNRRAEGWTDGPMEGRMKGRTEGRRDGGTDRERERDVHRGTWIYIEIQRDTSRYRENRKH